MNARKLMTGLLGAALIAFGSFGLVGCSEATAPATDMEEALINATLPAPMVDEGIFTEATEDMQMVVVPPQSDHHRHPFGRLLRALQLTEDQQVTVKRLLAAHEDCVKGVMERLRATEREILAPYHERRDAVMAQLRAGEIDRAEARRLLAQINKEAREALRANPALAAAREALKACREEFITQLKSILTEEQIAILERWLASQGPRGPHDDKGGRGGRPDGEGGGTGPGRGRG
jgi:hypothetical protein